MAAGALKPVVEMTAAGSFPFAGLLALAGADVCGDGDGMTAETSEVPRPGGDCSGHFEVASWACVALAWPERSPVDTVASLLHTERGPPVSER